MMVKKSHPSFVGFRFGFMRLLVFFVQILSTVRQKYSYGFRFRFGIAVSQIITIFEPVSPFHEIIPRFLRFGRVSIQMAFRNFGRSSVTRGKVVPPRHSVYFRFDRTTDEREFWNLASISVQAQMAAQNTDSL